LLNRYTVKSRIEGSNPSVSASFPDKCHRTWISKPGKKVRFRLGTETGYRKDPVANHRVPYLVRRGNSFYFRMAVSDDLMHRMSRREIKYSLRREGRWRKRSTRRSPSDILGSAGDGPNRGDWEIFRHDCLENGRRYNLFSISDNSRASCADKTAKILRRSVEDAASLKVQKKLASFCQNLDFSPLPCRAS
jgi:hypothetical protein